MEKQESIDFLKENYESFVYYLGSLSEEEFEFASEDKWTAGMQLEHLIKSVMPVNFAFGLPAFFIKWRFGKANRPSRTYDELVGKYQGKLAAGGKSTKRYNPNPVAFQRREILSKLLLKIVNQLCRKASRSSNKKLDTLILPHPLLGMVTFREILYFTAYHAKHHQKGIEKMLETS